MARPLSKHWPSAIWQLTATEGGGGSGGNLVAWILPNAPTKSYIQNPTNSDQLQQRQWRARACPRCAGLALIVNITGVFGL
jgi:hypothetical protein